MKIKYQPVKSRPKPANLTKWKCLKCGSLNSVGRHTCGVCETWRGAR